MDVVTWNKVCEELSRILDAPPDQRRKLLAEVDPRYRDEVESLLNADADASDFNSNASPDGALRVGDRIGSYEVVREIGRGGMGIVYEVERVDGQFKRRAAVKLSNGRMFGRDAERRFLRERQILAELDHPNIVKLLDGGMNGRQPYLVMELISGQPITEHVGRNLLGLPERLRLFRAACSAIHYAHQRLIIHRDLKPGNIFVNDAGEVKILDFGIAQILSDSPYRDASEATLLHPLSLQCASPEQVRSMPVSIATDIYALGVLLYELITGKNPQHAPGLPFDEVVRRITLESPPPANPRELDAIARKAMAKEPADRYSSVAELQSEIDNFLEGRPVRALRPGVLYIARKAIVRHRALSVAIGMIVLLLCAGAASYIRQARLEARRFEEARRLIHSVIFDIQPRLDSVAGSLPVRRALLTETMRYLENMSKDAGDSVPLLKELSGAYVQMARIQGYAMGPNIGDPAEASRSLHKAEELLKAALAREPDDPALLLDASNLYSNLTQFDVTNLDQAAGETHSRLGLEFAERAARAGIRGSRVRLAEALYDRGQIIEQTDREQAYALYERARKAFRELTASGQPSLAWDRRIVLCEWRMAENRIAGSDWQAAEPHAADALAMTERIYNRDKSDARSVLQLGSSLVLSARVAAARGELDAARTMVLRALDFRRESVTRDPTNAQARERLGAALWELAKVETKRRQWTAVTSAAREAIGIYEQLLAQGALKPYLALALPDCYRLLARAGAANRQQSQDACRHIRESLRLYQVFEPHYRGRAHFARSVDEVKAEVSQYCAAPAGR